MNHVEIQTGAVFGSRTGTGSKVEIDGQDILNGIRGFTVCARVGQITAVEIDMPVLKATTVSGEAYVFLIPETVAALVALGWTPPEQPFDHDHTKRYDPPTRQEPAMPTLARVARHIEQLLAADIGHADRIRELLPAAAEPVVDDVIAQLLAADPANADRIRELLPPQEPIEEDTPKVEPEPVAAEPAPEPTPAEPAAVDEPGIPVEPTAPVAKPPRKRATKTAAAAVVQAEPDKIDVSTFDQEPGSVTVNGQIPAGTTEPQA